MAEFGFLGLGYDKDGYNKKGFDRNGFDREGYNIEGFNKFGYNREGFDKEGFDKRGYNKEGYHKITGLNINGFNKYGFDKDGFNKDGFDKHGFDKEGYNANGYDREGFDRRGYDKYGFDRNGYDINGFNKQGYDKEGYNENGFDKEGYDRLGYNQFGFDKRGYNKEGFDRNGFDINGYNKDGYDKLGFNIEGFDKEGFDKEGYNKEGFDKKGYDREGYDKDGYNKKGFNKDGFDVDGYNRQGFNKLGYNRQGFDKFGFDIYGYDIDGYNIYARDREGYNIVGYDSEGYNREGYDIDGFQRADFDIYGFNKYTHFNKEGYDKEGFNINGINKLGYDREGFNLEGVDKDGFDRNGFDSHGFNSQGFDKNGYNRQGYNCEGFDKFGYNREGFDTTGYNRLGYDKEGYDKNGLNAEGKRKSSIISLNQLQFGQRIKSKKDGVKGEILGVFNGVVRYSLDHLNGSGISTTCGVDKFMELYLLDDVTDGEDRIRESKYCNKVKKYLNSEYLSGVILPNIRRTMPKPREYTYIDRSGFLVHHKDEYDEFEINRRASEELSKTTNDAYFCHIDYSQNPDLYIGRKEIPGFVVDWSDKRASYYYQYEIYAANEELGINFVRDIILKNASFYDYKDKFNRIANSNNRNIQNRNIADEKLIEIIERNRESKSIHDIVESIQKQQYEIITDDIENNSLILGCAGSGKTMILLHRIRYIMFNHPEMDIKQMLIVSPTDILGRESKELFKILNIDNARQFSTATFYSGVIETILGTKKLFNRVKEFIINDNKIDKKSLNIDKCLKIINQEDSYKDDYIKERKLDLYKEKDFVVEIIGKGEIDNAKKLYEEALTELLVYSESDIRAIIAFANNIFLKELPKKLNIYKALQCLIKFYKESKKEEKENIEVEVKEQKEEKEIDRSKINKLLQNFYDYVVRIDVSSIDSFNFETEKPITRLAQIICMLANETSSSNIKNLILDLNKLSFKEIKSCIGNLEEEINKINKLEKISEVLGFTLGFVNYSTNTTKEEYISINNIVEHFKNLEEFYSHVKQQCVSNNINAFELFNVYMDILDEEKLVDNAYSSDDYVFDMLIKELGLKRDRYNKFIIIDKTRLEVMFNILLSAYKVENTKKYYLFLDEFQDYSIEELKNIKTYFKNSIFSLYGDVNQCIYEDGIKSKNELDCVFVFDKQYELKENYRNAHEITTYVNSRFNMSMYEIGLPGSVKEIEQLSLYKLDDGDRAAIIVSSEEMIQKLNLLDFKNVCRYDNNGIQKNIYTILTVAQAKGLEFEKVIVIENGMTKNQSYVACTRAIKNLYVINSNKSLNSTGNEIKKQKTQQQYDEKKLQRVKIGEIGLSIILVLKLAENNIKNLYDVVSISIEKVEKLANLTKEEMREFLGVLAKYNINKNNK